MATFLIGATQRSNGGKQSLVLTATFFRAGFADELGVSPSSYVDDGAALSRHFLRSFIESEKEAVASF